MISYIFSLFREAGAILAAGKGVREFDPDRFAREFVVPPDQEHRLLEVCSPPAALETEPKRHREDQDRKSQTENRQSPPCSSVHHRGELIVSLAKDLQIAPGLLVGRLQHDGLITWKQHNSLKRQVDLSWVLTGAEALEETWPDQTSATNQVMRDFGLEARAARERVRRAAASGTLITNGQRRAQMRFEPGALAAWRLKMRDKDLDAEEAA